MARAGGRAAGALYRPGKPARRRPRPYSDLAIAVGDESSANLTSRPKTPHAGLSILPSPAPGLGRPIQIYTPRFFLRNRGWAKIEMSDSLAEVLDMLPDAIQIQTSCSAVRSPPSSPVLRTPRGSISSS